MCMRKMTGTLNVQISVTKCEDDVDPGFSVEQNKAKSTLKVIYIWNITMKEARRHSDKRAK